MDCLLDDDVVLVLLLLGETWTEILRAEVSGLSTYRMLSLVRGEEQMWHVQCDPELLCR